MPDTHQPAACPGRQATKTLPAKVEVSTGGPFGDRLRDDGTLRHFLLVCWLPTLILCLTTGCLGPKAVRHSRQKYNEAVQVTASEQLLLNLVRLRYRDAPVFMELGSLSTQFAFGQTASASGTLIERSSTPDVLGLDLNLNASERPTATYSPLRGQAYVEQLISPIDLKTITLLTRSGWSVDRVLRMMVQSLNGVENAVRASGPTPVDAPDPIDYEPFRQLVGVLRQMQRERDIRAGYEVTNTELSGPIPATGVSAEHALEAAKKGWKLQYRQDRVFIPAAKIAIGKPDALRQYLDENLLANLVKDIRERGQRTPVHVRWVPATNGEKGGGMFVVVSDDLLLKACQEAAVDPIECLVLDEANYVLTGEKETLVLKWDFASLNPTQRGYLQQLPNLEKPNVGRYEIDIEPRSLLGTMYYLSHAIRIPKEHLAAGVVTQTFHEWGEPFDWATVTGDLLCVQCQDVKPEHAAVAVKYRGYWFFIDDRDQSSKATFVLLLGLFELQAGGSVTGVNPVLTLPL